MGPASLPRVALLWFASLAACAAAPTPPPPARDEAAPLRARVERLDGAARAAAAAVAELPSPLAEEVAARLPRRVAVFAADLRALADDGAQRACVARDLTVLEAVLERLRAPEAHCLATLLARLDDWGMTLGSCAGTRPQEGLAPADVARVEALQAAGIAAWVADDLRAARDRYRDLADLGRRLGRPAIAARALVLLAVARDDTAEGVAEANADCAAALALAREARDPRAETRALGCALAGAEPRTAEAARAYRDRAEAEGGPRSADSLYARTLWLSARGVSAEAAAAERELLLADTRGAGPRFLREHLRLRHRAANARRYRGDPEAALRALDELRPDVVEHDGERGEALINLDGERGATLNALGRYEEALALAEGVCPRADAIGRPDATGCIQALAVEGAARRMLGRPDACAPLRESAARIVARFGPTHVALGAQYATLGWCLSRSGAQAEALAAYREAQRSYDLHQGEGSAVAQRNRLSVALTAAATGDEASARADLARARRLLDDPSLDATDRVAVERLVGETLNHLGDAEEALPLLAHAEASLGGVDASVARDVRRQYVIALRATARFGDAARVSRDLLGGATPTARDAHAAEAARWLADSLRRDGDARGAAQALAPLVAEAGANVANDPELAVVHAGTLVAQRDAAGALRAVPAPVEATRPAARARVWAARADALRALGRRAAALTALAEAEAAVATLPREEAVVRADVARLRGALAPRR